MSKVTLEEVRNNLPVPPISDSFEYSYSLERVSPMVIKVWLNHHHNFDYACGRPVRTIYCFLKNDKVHPPKSKDKMQVKSICTIDELEEQNPYSTIKPSGSRNLWNLG